MFVINNIGRMDLLMPKARLNKPKSPEIKRHNSYEKRLDAILKAASKVMARDGFRGASIRDVAARGKIGLSSIYYYFKSKDELLFAIQNHTFLTLVSTLKEKLADASTSEKKLSAVIDNHFNFFIDNMDDLKVCVHEIESLSGKYYKNILKIRQEYYRLVKEIITEFLSGSDYEADLATLFLFGSLNWVYMWYDPQVNKDIKKLSAQFLKVYLNGIKNYQT